VGRGGGVCCHSAQSLIPVNLNIKSVILPALLYGFETWSLTLSEEHRLKMSENRALRRIFGPKGEEVAGGWRKLQDEKLYNLYSSPNIIRVCISKRMSWTGHVARIVQMGNGCSILVRKSEGKNQLKDLDLDGKIILKWILGK
jgi:hypothetical protein